MGHYTEVYVNANLRSDIDANSLKILNAVVYGDDEEIARQGRPARWAMLFKNMSYYTPNTRCAELTKDPHFGDYSIIGKGDIKNYEGEIEQFFEFLIPLCDDADTFVGYSRYEDSRTPTLVFTPKEG